MSGEEVAMKKARAKKMLAKLQRHRANGKGAEDFAVGVSESVSQSVSQSVSHLLQPID